MCDIGRLAYVQPQLASWQHVPPLHTAVMELRVHIWQAPDMHNVSDIKCLAFQAENISIRSLILVHVAGHLHRDRKSALVWKFYSQSRL